MSTVYEVVGDVMGDVMGDDVGYDIDGDEIGAAPVPARRMATWRHGPPAVRPPSLHGAQRVLIAKKPDWRHGQAAPGVMLPDEGMVPLGMTPQTNGGVFTSTIPTITWVGQLQKPYRAERLLVSSVRTGATSTGRLLGQFFVGVDLNMGTLQAVDIELFGATTAFGTRLTLLQAPPGVLIQVPVTVSSGLTAPDTIFATIQWAGRIIH